MDMTILLLLAASGVLLIPLLSEDDDDESDKNEVRGTLEDDIPLDGTDGDDLILGFDGNDTINGGAGLDFINAGLGNDTVNGGDGRDVIEGRAGDDILNGDDGNDTILGGAGDDDINGGFGSDIIRGGRGADEIFGGFGARLLDGELNNATDRTDTLRGEGGEDEIYLWGGGGLAVGGQNSDDPGTGDEKDVLVLVTGEGRLEDSEGTTDFFALANIENDEETFAIITEFDESEHRMILTVDIDLDGAAATPQVGFEATLSTIEEGDETVNGFLITAKLLNPDDFPDAEFEESSAFFRGEANTTSDDLQTFVQDNYDIEVVFTDAADNDYVDPETTINAINSQIPDNPPVPV
ncbi:calcium-binding protein [Roseobacter sp. CCS2]|uniref:calcium-binding protein n=1 Tax=Roseobacter sp. CCS2 TaxID=391593 RepID=UPI0000F3E32C|nr:calcium-binding protein [Roseobacter sp. CCS2]EBA12322.1 Hemolysin-type calcium-binding protein [Roseobacter sp. CCS2]